MHFLQFAEYKPGRLERVIRIVSFTVQCGGICLPFCVGIVACLFPCSPPFLSSLFLYGEACGCVWPATAALEVIIWMPIGAYGVHYSLYVILVLLLYLFKKFQEANDIKSRKLYNEVRVFERILNASLKGRIAPVLIFGAALVQYFAGCVLLSMSKELGHTERYVCLLAYIETALFVPTMLGIAARLFVLSKGFCNMSKRLAKRKADKKEVMSWRAVRVEFGGNFVDALTPLVLEGNVVNQTISFAVVYRSK